ncbi:mavicyanin-like [Macadamia integrifolia]|uniref:mavicyanin-like n=1 Tax=Macadamia integrifolia TaxID=60698 RepID=UPI001C52CE9E|nr:mavicyanin-like [Macadamia integrifolia]
MAKLQLSLLLLMAMGCVIMAPMNAMITHNVGGSFGWSIPKDPNFYQDWANPRTFGVGDKLVFTYVPMVHNVLEVIEKDFTTCNPQEKPIHIHTSGVTIVELTNSGNYYFFCAYGKHCELGQKLNITVGYKPGSTGGTVASDAATTAAGYATNLVHNKSSCNSIHFFGLVSGIVVFLVLQFHCSSYKMYLINFRSS